MYIIKLACTDCGRPWGYITDGSLLIESRHGGDKHTNVISITKLLALLRGSQTIRDEDMIKELLRQLNLSPSLVATISPTDPK